MQFIVLKKQTRSGNTRGAADDPGTTSTLILTFLLQVLHKNVCVYITIYNTYVGDV